MTAGIVVPVLNNFKGFTELVRSVDMPALWYVQDNWNDNIGVGPAWNRGLEWAVQKHLDHLIIVNDDVIFRPGVATGMLYWLNKGFDLVSPQNETGVCHPYGLNFWCFAVKPTEFIERFGYFDENFAPAYYEDDDMWYRMKLAGGTMKTLPDRIHHAVGASGSLGDNEIWNRNLEYYKNKWGGEPNQETFSTPFNEVGRSVKVW